MFWWWSLFPRIFSLKTPMAFGWLPKETINLDISTCVCVQACVCAWACVYVCCSDVSERSLLLLFYCTQTQVWAKADQSENMRKHATMQCIAQTPGLFSCYLKRNLYHMSLLPTIIPHLHPNSLPNCHHKTSFYVNTSQPLLPIFHPASYLCKP